MIETLLRPRRRSLSTKKWHAVPRSRDTALCGGRPPLGGEWTDPGEAVTCPRCQILTVTLVRVAAGATYDPRSLFASKQLWGETRRLIQLRRLGLIRQADHLWSLSNEGLLDRAIRGQR